MATTIVTKNGSGAPAASDLVAGELAVDLTNGRLYTEDSGGSVIEIGLNPSGNVDVTGSVTADKLITDSGVDAASFTSTGSTYVDINNGTVTGRLQTISSDFFIGTATVGTSLAFKSGNGVEAMRIDSSGNTTFKANNSAVGPIVTLENTATAVNGQAWGSIHFDSNDSSTGASGTRASIIGTSTSFNGDGNLTFSTAPANGSNTERMRLDSSGNLLVGKSVTTFGTAGIALRGTVADFTRDGGTPINVNRLTSDGSLIDFHKAGTVVGSIGSYSGVVSYLVLDPRANGAGLVGLTNEIAPANELGNPSDAAKDLGSSSRRFKDLYLSGGAYLGGTAAANKLDDYEEGTWTLTITTSGTGESVSIGSTTGTYTKIGRQVTATIYTSGVNVSAAGSGAVLLGGLPFTCSNGIQFYAVPSFGHTTLFSYEPDGYVTVNTNHITVTRVGTTTSNALSVGNPRYMMMTVTYFTDS